MLSIRTVVQNRKKQKLFSRNIFKNFKMKKCITKIAIVQQYFKITKKYKIKW